MSRKLESASPPVWRAYPGLSILYDDPGSAALSGVQPLEALPRNRSGQERLYDRLRRVVEDLASSAGQAEDALGLLPRHTYHVTLCDGVNEGTRRHVRAEAQGEVARTLDELPDSLLWTNDVLRLLRDPELYWSVWCHPVSFRVDRLCLWGHALAASLEPADERSVAAKAAHEASRHELAARLHDRLGVPSQDWQPHVTLGYVANDAAAAHVRDHVLAGWQETVRERTAGLSVTFRAASLYGFTDMASFWRLGQ